MSELPNAESSLHLMPVAAFLGCFAIFSIFSLITSLYSSSARVDTIKSKPFAVQSLVTVVIAFCYGLVVGSIEASTAGIFDPLDILEISAGANVTVVKRAYKKMSLLHHPDKAGGSKAAFQKIAKAYEALTDPLSMENLEKYGHPDGRQGRATVSFAAPDWLLHPEGSTAAVMLLMYLGFFAWLIYFVYKSFARKSAPPVPAGAGAVTGAAGAAAAGAGGAAQSPQLQAMTRDLEYIAKNMTPFSSHTDVLWWIANAPGSVAFANAGLQAVEDAQKKKEENGLDLAAGGWADDGDDDATDLSEAEKQRKNRDEMERNAIMSQTSKAAGSMATSAFKFEGVDKDVKGVKYIQERLNKLGAWPPKIDCLIKGSPSYLGPMPADKDGEVSSNPIGKPEIERNMTMMLHRVNGAPLQPDLMAQDKSGLLDTKYFSDMAQFRQRTMMLLESCLKISVHNKIAPLVRVIIETMCMFKLGMRSATDPQMISMFQNGIQRLHGPGTVPKLQVKAMSIATPDCDDVPAGEVCALTMDLKRPHAAAFTKAQIAMCQARGIDPSSALSQFREIWWIILTVTKIVLKDGTVVTNAQTKDGRKLFVEQLVLAWPSVCGKIDQEDLKLQLKFKAPQQPGQYTFKCDIKAQDVLGADSSTNIVVDVVNKIAAVTTEDDGDVVVVSPKAAGAKKNE